MFLLLLSKTITLSIYGFAIYVLLSMLFENEEDEKKSDKKRQCKYYGDMTVIHVNLQSKERLDKVTKHLVMSHLNNKLQPDQCFINDHGEIYLILYKAYIDVNKVNELDNIYILNVFDDGEEIDTKLVKSVSVLGFNDKKSFMGFMSKCSILSCQRFLDNYYRNESNLCETPSPKSTPTTASASAPTTRSSTHTNTSMTPTTITSSNTQTSNEIDLSSSKGQTDELSVESERSMSLENYYIFPHTIKNLVRFSKETKLDVNMYNDMWGTWVKYNEEGDPVMFSGFPINEETLENASDFVMSSYKKTRKCLSMNYDHTKWYETYGKICYNSSTNVCDMSNDSNSTDSESEEYVKL